MDCVRLDILEVLADALSFGILLRSLLIGRGKERIIPFQKGERISQPEITRRIH